MPKLTQLKQLASNRQLRRILSVLIILITLAVVIKFFMTHFSYIRNLRHIKPLVIAEIIGLNAVLTVVLTFTYDLTLRICGKKVSFRENFLLTAYSSLANFFGPLQSGPGVRMVYLKAKHQVRLRDYTLATLIQYAMFAFISALMLFGFSMAWWVTSLILIAVVVACLGVIGFYIRKSEAKKTPPRLNLQPNLLLGLLITSLLTVLIITTYYFIELRAVSVHISLHQAIIYSGAANFALFVSLTPDAVGIRESFLVLSKHLHRISTAIILAANIIDRGAYLIYLVILGIFVLVIHASDKLNLKQFRQESS